MSEQRSGWTLISELATPYNDAFNYRTREQKEFFKKLFLRTAELRKCLDPSIYYLMGEKGTGKTAYAIYLENNSFENRKCEVITMTEAQYRHFIDLKAQGRLTYADYSSIWRCILLYLAGRMVAQKSKGFLASIAKKFDKVQTLLEQWEEVSHNPEIEVAFQAVRALDARGEGKVGPIKAKAGYKSENTEGGSTIRNNLLTFENQLKEAISALALPADNILFVDGIDYRPEGIAYTEYLACVKGLGEAVWQLNMDFFANVRDTKGRFKVVLLVRPDVFHKLNLYNSNSRLQDNAILLDWSTTESEFASSTLFEVSGRYFASQQQFPAKDADAWDHYYEATGTRSQLFRGLLKTTFQKPRDILTFIKISKAALKPSETTQSVFPGDIVRRNVITRQFADYLLGEVRNYSAFYMPSSDFDNYLKFFQFLDGHSRFSMAEFVSAHAKFDKWARGETIKAREYLRDPEALLQLLYDVNVLGYQESVRGDSGSETFFHWSYRERSLNNIAPKVKAADVLLLNPGIAKALDIGKSLVPGPARQVPKKRRRNRNNRRRHSAGPNAT